MIRKQLDTFALQYSNTTVEGLKAPCTLYGALMKASTLDNLDYALNAKALGTVGTLPFCISTTLTVNESMLSYQHVVLRVCDLSAPANFTVGEGRFSLDDEQRVYTLEIGQYLKEGKNLLCFEFLPETSEGAPYEGDGFFDRGIFRRLEIIAYNESFIDNIKCRQVHENGKVTLHISAKTYGDPTGSEIVASIVSPGGSTYYCGLHKGEGSVLISDPVLWWPHTLGTPSLYRLTLTVYREGEIVESKTTNIGLRSVALSLADGMGEKEFALSVGGERFFVTGAQLRPDLSLPMDRWLSRLESFVECCVMANVNLIFVPEQCRHLPERFYELCDKHGVLVMQDILPPRDAAQSEDATRSYLEVLEQTLLSICAHPSLALLRSHLTGEDSIREIPELAAACVPDAVYTNTFLSVAQQVNMADTSAAFPVLEGTASIPAVSSLRRFIPSDQMNPYSEIPEARTSAPISKILSYSGERYPYAMSMEQLVYLTQLTQAHRTVEEVNYLRLKRPTAMGVILGAASDPFGRISPSIVDSYGERKAVSYALRDAYAPDALILRRDGYRVHFYLSNETRAELSLTLHYRLLDSKNNLLKEERIEVNSPKDTLTLMHSADFSALAHKRENEVYLHAALYSGDTELHSKIVLFVAPKRFLYEDAKPETSISGAAGEYTLILSPYAFMQSVYLYFEGVEAFFSDNFFDLTKNAPVRIRFTTVDKSLEADALAQKLRILSVYNVGK